MVACFCISRCQPTCQSTVGSALTHYKPFCFTNRIYTVHDKVKDKEFELELSWVGEGKATYPLASDTIDASPCAVTGGKHQVVPADIKAEAEQYAEAAINDSDSDDED